MCIAGAGFLIAVYLLLTIFPVPLYNSFKSDGEPVAVTGYVNTLHYRNDKLQIYLKNVIFSDDDSGNKQLNNEKGCGFETESFGAIAYLSSDTAPPKIGQRIKLRGTLHNMTRATNPGQFDMAAYYKIRGIDFSLVSCSILESSADYNAFMNSIYLVRSYFEEHIRSALGDEEGGVLCAMILGDRDYLSQELKDLFSNAGISHLMVVSGTHIGIIGVFIFEFLQRLTKSLKISLIVSAAFIVLYALMTGMGSSTFRAVVMYLLCVLSKLTGRAYDLLTALCFSSVISLAANPLQLYDSGFVLSYCAVLGISLLLPEVKSLESKIPFLKLPGLSLSLSVTLFSLPITLYLFYKITVYSILLNLILIPLSGVLIGTGIVYIIMCAPLRIFPIYIELPLKICAFVCHIIIRLYELLCKLTVSIPGATLITGKPKLWVIVLYYLALILFIRLKKHPRLKITALLLYIAAILLLPAGYRDFELTMLDVGQGLCVVARQEGHCFIFDMGSTDNEEVARYRIIPALKSMGVAKVDIILISHTDNDHISGLKEWLSDYENEGIVIGAIAMSPNSYAGDEGREIFDLAAEKGIRTLKIGAGDRLNVGKMELSCIYPKKSGRGDTNELSLCVRLRSGDVTALLCGDVEGDGEAELIKKLETLGDTARVDIFQVAHHGSGGTNSARLLKLLSPGVSLISAGYKNSYGHPSNETLLRLKEQESRYFVTINSGAVRIRDGSTGNEKKLIIDSFIKDGGER